MLFTIITHAVRITGGKSKVKSIGVSVCDVLELSSSASEADGTCFTDRVT